jgi:hypothetical protein
MDTHHDRTDKPTPATASPHSEPDELAHDTAYSPGSETETARKQDERTGDAVDADIDESQVQVAPGTGGPDDVGEVTVDPEDINLSGH